MAGALVLALTIAALVGLRAGREPASDAARADETGAAGIPVAWSERNPAAIVAAVEAADATARRGRLLENARRVRPVLGGATSGWRTGGRVALPLFDREIATGEVVRVGERADGVRLVSGRLDAGGTFTLATSAADGGLRAGLILPADGDAAYRLLRADDGGLLLAELPKASVLCATLPRPPSRRGTASFARSSGASGASVEETPSLESRPGAEPVLYLDFDGETVNDPVWNGGATIEAAPSGLSAEEIRRVWAMVAEDYRPFRINVTTDPGRYAAARPMQRMRCIITPTRDWYGEVGGVALVFSWRDAGAGAFATDVPCWVFSEPGVMTPEDVALAVSHEAGHTLGLYHDGLRGEDGVTPPEGDYYQGHGEGATAWGPIMGAPYGKPLIQWSRGDYSVGAREANNPQDDIALIATIENHVGFAPERRAETLADAGRLRVATDDTTVDHRGLVERAGAEDWLIFASGAGPIELELAPDDPEVPTATNFDGALVLTTPSGSVLASADEDGTCFPKLAATVPAGVYVLRVRSVGEGSPADGGYSDYGSVGRYRVVGRVNPPDGVAPLVGGAPRGEGRAGETFSYPIEAAGSDLSYAAENLPSGLTVDAQGRVTGTPETAGVWTASVRATNGAGSSSRAVLFAIAGASLGETLDAPGQVFATGGARPWRPVAEPDAPKGGSSARSGELLDDNGESWIETTVNGPGTLRWKWRVSSEKDYDFLHLSVDGTVMAAISGEVDWAERALEIGPGAHLVRWSYDKDDYLSENADSAWLDDVRWERGFERWAAVATLSGNDAAPEADPDNDGVANLLEYALARDPHTPDGLGETLRVEAVATDDDEGRIHLEITFVRPPGREDLRYVVEVSDDLVTWRRGHAYGADADNQTTDLPTVEVERTALSDGGERVRVRDGAVVGEETPRRFLRLRVERS
jgi:hypothetical protein